MINVERPKNQEQGGDPELLWKHLKSALITNQETEIGSANNTKKKQESIKNDGK